MARRFRGGELAGGETPWWRGDRIPAAVLQQVHRVQHSAPLVVQDLGVEQHLQRLPSM